MRLTLIPSLTGVLGMQAWISYPKMKFIRSLYSSAVFINSGERFFEGTPPFRCDLLKNLKHRDLFLQKFRNLCHEKYLLGLKELTRNLYQPDFNDVFVVDDVVFIKNPAKSRPNWSLGRVIRVTPGNDTYIRSALIKKSDGTTQEHPFSLELSIIHSHRTSEPPGEFSGSENISGIPADTVVGASGSNA